MRVFSCWNNVAAAQLLQVNETTDKNRHSQSVIGKLVAAAVVQDIGANWYI